MGAKAYSIDEIAARLAPLFKEEALQIILLFGSQSSGKEHPERHAPPDDYHQSFIRAGELGILSPALAEELAPSAGPGNRLVHEYDRIDHSIILKAVAMAEEYYPRGIEKNSAYISRKARPGKARAQKNNVRDQKRRKSLVKGEKNHDESGERIYGPGSPGQ